jgi:glycosyltransferase involved in cell wall biosynthesis
MKLSILMPVYNEAPTVALAVKRVLDVTYPCDIELVVVNDGSTDGTADRLADVDDPRVRVLTHERNRGKGAAVRTAAAAATGDLMIICDADLEYSPDEIPKLVTPALEGRSQVVYGTRTFGSHSAYSFWYVVGNRVITHFANVSFNSYISDLETGFKLLPLPLFASLDMRSDGFGMEAELTSKLLKLGERPFDVPISYQARSREQGKKITWRDGVAALWIIARCRLFWRPPRSTPTQ